MKLVNTRSLGDRYNSDEPDGWIDGEPYWLLNPRLHKASISIDYGLKCVGYIPELDKDRYIKEVR